MSDSYSTSKPDPYAPTGLSYFFAPRTPEPPPSPGSLDSRRRIAQAIAARRASPYPKTFGEGLTALGEGIADRSQMETLDRAERARDLGIQAEIARGRPLPGTPVPGASVPGAVQTPGVVGAAPTPGYGWSTAELNNPDEQPFTVASDEPAPTPETRSPAFVGGEKVPMPPPRPVYDRNQQLAELQDNPVLADRIRTIAKGESSDPREQQIVAETIFNRAAARNQPLEQVTKAYTGPGSSGYYPASTFGRGQISEDALAPVLRGSDVGGQALGFSPTGNASAGVADRGVASGRYNAAGRLPGSGETFVQQEPPAQVERLAATRLTSLSGGAGVSPTTATDAADNPPIMRDDIQVAQAGSRPAVPSGPDTLGRTPQVPIKTFEFRNAPRMNEVPTADELYGMELMRRHPGDADYAAIATPYIAFGQAQRKAEYEQKLKDYDTWKTEYAAQQASERIRPKTEGELREQEKKLPWLPLQQQQEATKREQENAVRAREASFAAVMGNMPPDVVAATRDEFIKNKRPEAEAFAQGITAIHDARAALSQGAITGLGADARINWGRLMTLMGRPDQGSEAANSQAFAALLSPVITAQRRAQSGNNNISNADIENAKQAAGANVNLDPRTMHLILNTLERNARDVLRQYDTRSKTLFGTPKDEAAQAIFGTPEYNTEPQRLPPPPAGKRVQVWSAEDAKRYPSGTQIILPNGNHGKVP